MGNACCAQSGVDELDKSRVAMAHDNSNSMSAMAIVQLVQGTSGHEEGGNKKLKMFMTSAGLMPKSPKLMKQAYYDMTAKTSGTGVLYVIDAKVQELQFYKIKDDPEKYNKEKQVAYQRNPEEPGGEPVRKEGKLVMKTQEELFAMNKCNALYSLRKHGHFSNGDLSVLCEGQTGQWPVYFTYMAYQGDMVGGKPDYKCFVGEGYFENGRFVAKKADGTDFKESDYEEEWASQMDETATPFFRQMEMAEFENIVSKVKTIWSCGGNVWATVLALEPEFHDKNGNSTGQKNLYGCTILDAVKEGSVVYCGQSAGAVSFSWCLGPLTADTAEYEIEEDDEHHRNLNLGETGMLGVDWKFPPLGKYVGMPYRLMFRPHVGFNIETGKFGIVGTGVKKVQEIVDHSEEAGKHDCFCVLMMDYNYAEGRSDSVRIFNGEVRYLVGQCDDARAPSAETKAALSAAHPEWVETNPKVRIQPSGIPPEGHTFDWHPSQGPVWAAGPKAKVPFRIYANQQGHFPDAPYY